jgi:hypothetical protein
MASVVVDGGEMSVLEAQNVGPVEASIVEEAFSMVDKVELEVAQQSRFKGK